jgi:N-acylglucosamine-6-phosphate 2-epimerase
MLLMAECALKGGAAGFRVNSPENIKPIKDAFPDVPLIGIWKRHTDNPVYITPTMAEVDALAELGCEIIATDCTNQVNAQGKYAWEIIKEIKSKYPDIVVMADIATVEDAKIAAREGADIIATTMSGYTEQSKVKVVDQTPDGTPDFDLLRELKAENLNSFILFEGRIWTREEAVECFAIGADCICIGKAITNPYKITARFVNAVNNFFNNDECMYNTHVLV